MTRFSTLKSIVIKNIYKKGGIKIGNEFNVKKAIELYREVNKQPFEVKDALFNALRRDLNEETLGE